MTADSPAGLPEHGGPDRSEPRQDGAQQDGAQQDAARQDGTQQDGAQQDGAQPNGPEQGAAAEPALPPALAAVRAALGPQVEVVEQYERILATVPPARWAEAMTAARDVLGADFLDWLTAVDELEEGYLVAAFVVATADRGPGRLGRAQGVILRTRVAKDAEQGATLASVVGVYRGAAWHEREAFEMFGIEFTGHEGLRPLLLPDGFEGHPLRKDFVLASRVAKAWPGAKEPGESEHQAAAGSPGRRRMLPPGVPGEEWLKPHEPAPGDEA